MASLEDLRATISGMHVGQHDDLKELHAKLAQTLHPTKAPFRPIPPPTATFSPQTETGPLPPPAPASSWNDGVSGPIPQTSNAWGGMGNSPRQGGFSGKRETGFSIPPPKSQHGGGGGDQGREEHSGGGGMPYHASVLPIRASPKDTGGFENDAFKPLWEDQRDQQPKEPWSGFKKGGK